MRTDISFSPWTSWKDRNSLPKKNEAGVYLIGRFTEQPPSGPRAPLDEHVVYIGESAGGRFRSRWRSFGRTAFEGKGRHRGGIRYRQKFGGNSSEVYVSILPENEMLKAFLGFGKCSFIDNIPSGVKVTAPIEFDALLDEIDDLLIKYVERRLILLYAIVHGNRPPCNAD